MFAIIKNQFKPACLMLLWMTLLTGLAYPLAMTGIAKVLFPEQAGGSLIRRDGAVVGSRLVGRDFTSPAHFHGRPSATAPRPATPPPRRDRTSARRTRSWPRPWPKEKRPCRRKRR